jgi:hypothetical protein
MKTIKKRCFSLIPALAALLFFSCATLQERAGYTAMPISGSVVMNARRISMGGYELNEFPFDFGSVNMSGGNSFFGAYKTIQSYRFIANGERISTISIGEGGLNVLGVEMSDRSIFIEEDGGTLEKKVQAEPGTYVSFKIGEDTVRFTYKAQTFSLGSLVFEGSEEPEEFTVFVNDAEFGVLKKSSPSGFYKKDGFTAAAGIEPLIYGYILAVYAVPTA